MGELRKGQSVACAVTIALAALLALYVGAYYAAVVPVDENTDGIGGPIMVPSYSWGSSGFFAPVHWLDRHLRPHVWPYDD